MDKRYSRQILFSPIGKKGQDQLSKSRILLIGCGALGTAHAETLARAGVGFLRIVDRDFVETSNLQRQSLFSEDDARNQLPKAIAAKNRLQEINSEIEVDDVVADINPTNIRRLLGGIDLVLDGADNFQVRYLVNDACLKLDTPWIYGAAVSSYGTSMTIIPHKTPCLRCIFEDIPATGSAPTCDTAGVIQPIISTISAVQTTEALKLLTARSKLLHRSLIHIDIWQNEHRSIKLNSPNPDCPACGDGRFDFLDALHIDSTATLCGRNAVQILPGDSIRIDLTKKASELSKIGDVFSNEYLLRLSIEGFELTLFADGRAIIGGSNSTSFARSIYAKYVGS